MNQPTENKIQRLLDLLEDERLLIKRMEKTCLEVEHELRAALNENGGENHE